MLHCHTPHARTTLSKLTDPIPVLSGENLLVSSRKVVMLFVSKIVHATRTGKHTHTHTHPHTHRESEWASEVPVQKHCRKLYLLECLQVVHKLGD